MPSVQQRLETRSNDLAEASAIDSALLGDGLDVFTFRALSSRYNPRMSPRPLRLRYLARAVTNGTIVRERQTCCQSLKMPEEGPVGADGHQREHEAYLNPGLARALTAFQPAPDFREGKEGQSAKPGVRASKQALGPECSPCVSVPSGWLLPCSSPRCGSCLPVPTRRPHVIAVLTHARASVRPTDVSRGPGPSVSERCTTRGIPTRTMRWTTSTIETSVATPHPAHLPQTAPTYLIPAACHRGCALAAQPTLVSRG
jgi:hypothetical protein